MIAVLINCGFFDFKLCIY